MAEDKTENSHGGARTGAGRKNKVEEERIKNLSIDAIKDVYKSEAEAWKFLAKQSKKSLPHFKLLFEYAYGKPKEIKEVELNGSLAINFAD